MVDIEKKQVPYMVQGDHEWAAELDLPGDDLLVNSVQVLSDQVKEFSRKDHVSVAVEPCRIVILYDPVTGSGLAGHFDSDGGEILYPQAQSFFEDISRVEAIFAGGSASSVDDPEFDIGQYLASAKAELEQGALDIGIQEQNMFRNWSGSTTATQLLFYPERGFASILYSHALNEDY